MAWHSLPCTFATAATFVGAATYDLAAPLLLHCPSRCSCSGSCQGGTSMPTPPPVDDGHETHSYHPLRMSSPHLLTRSRDAFPVGNWHHRRMRALQRQKTETVPRPREKTATVEKDQENNRDSQLTGTEYSETGKQMVQVVLDDAIWVQQDM
ncbi:hypothetical protein B0H13DRAFT_1909812 [Mycena leptocephala]|nr:hypothetical protein B0H13DRAFT_1909812 [Mycena leptocephala]